MQICNDPFTPKGTIRYAFDNNVWFIKCIGAICHPLAPTLNALIEQVITHPDSKHFIIDLTDAKLIDSTCLGILARIATRHNHVNTDKPIVITGGGNIAKTMLVVRFDLLFKLVEKLNDKPNPLQIAPDVIIEKDAMLNLLLDSHQRLCAIDAETHDIFKDVVQALEMDVKKNRN